ncbi:phosphatidylinositol 4-phosphate 5-kinase type-1 alpha-like, partial [Sitodiplosis mosellana]
VSNGSEITFKKMHSSHIMDSIQIAILHTVCTSVFRPKHDVMMNEFGKFETISFPPGGSSLTPAHHYAGFKFTIFAPAAFIYFREMFGIQTDYFVTSLCSAPLRELSNPAASGSLFYLSNDDVFIIKTVQHQEAEFLPKLLSGYYTNLNQNPHTLLSKFFGLYSFEGNGKNVRLVVMNNLLPSSVKIHQKYDFKGAIHKRKLNEEDRAKSSPTYRDLDFMEHHPNGIFLESDTYNALMKTIQRDCRLLESFGIMDYSLLVGVHNLDLAIREKQEKTKRPSHVIPDPRTISHKHHDPLDRPGGIPARNGKGERLLLFIGIIDVLQSYRLKRKLEHAYKSMVHNGNAVSVCDPSFYSLRFQDFIANTVFKKMPLHNSGQTELHDAAEDGNFEHICKLDVVEKLITKGAKIDSTDDQLRTPLHLAALNGHKVVAEKLISNGAKVDITDSFDRTALHLAAKNGYRDVVEMLIAKGANVNFENHLNETPLNYAVQNGNLKIVQLLVTNGASVTATDSCNKTPYKKAFENDNKEVADYLKEVEEKRRHGHK